MDVFRPDNRLVEDMNRSFLIIILGVLLVAPAIAVAGSPRFEATGLKDAEVHAFFVELKTAVNDHDVKKIASMVRYPLVVKGKASVQRPVDFISRYREIFTQNVISAIKRQSYKNLWGNWRGVMIGEGEVWFSGICRDQSCSSYEIKVIAVNN